MSDKLRQTAPIPVRFSAGEIPEPTKLDGMSVQFRRALSILEYVVGDAWNSGGDAFLAAVGVSTYALMLPNLSRYLGQSHYTNPRIPNTSTTTRYTHQFLTGDVGNHEAQLSLPPTAVTSFTWSGTGAPIAAPASSMSAANGTGEWYVDRNTGWCYFFDAIVADWKVQYIPTVASEFGSDSTWNVIPDPNTNSSYGFLGCKIAYTNNTDNSQGYIIYLPPRGPMSLTRRFDRSPQSSYDPSGNTENMTVTPDSTPVTLWQHYDNVGVAVDGTVGTYAEHYRYALPKIVTDNWSTSSLLPQGLIYLWDHSQTGTVIEGLSAYAENAASPRTYVLVASGTALDSWVTNYMNTAYSGCGGTAALTQRDDHDPSYYPSTGLRVVTVGNGVSEGVSVMMKTLMDHDHGSANSQPGKQINHGKLLGNFDGGEISGVTLHPSGFSSDWHPQYVHRGGYSTTRDIYGGGMLGDLFLCSSGSSSNYQNVTSNSRKILFGHPTSGPSLGYESAYDMLILDRKGFRIEWPTSNYLNLTPVSDDMSLQSSGRLILYPANNEIGLGQNGETGDYFSVYPGVGVNLYINNAIDYASGYFSIPGMAYIAHSGGIPTVYFETGADPRPRIVGTSGKVSVEQVGAGSPQGSGYNGELVTNRVYGGSYDDSEYGEQSGDWGPVRRIVLAPSDFIIFNHVAIGDTAPESCRYSDVVGGYSADGSNIKKATSIFLNDAGNDVVAFGYVKLPFVYYGIVNVLFAFKSHAGLAGTGIAEVAIGHSLFDTLNHKPGGTTVVTTDFAALSPTPSNTTAWQDNSQNLYRAFNYYSSPIVEVDNRYSHVVYAHKLPWVRFYVHSSGTRDVELSDVTILYRIKEW